MVHTSIRAWWALQLPCFCPASCREVECTPCRPAARSLTPESSPHHAPRFDEAHLGEVERRLQSLRATHASSRRLLGADAEPEAQSGLLSPHRVHRGSECGSALSLPDVNRSALLMGMDTFGWQAEHTKERCVTAAVDFITGPSRLMLHCGYGPRAGMGDDTYAEARMEHLLWRNGAAAAPHDLG